VARDKNLFPCLSWNWAGFFRRVGFHGSTDSKTHQGSLVLAHGAQELRRDNRANSGCEQTNGPIADFRVCS
jgi:hypothetical protein